MSNERSKYLSVLLRHKPEKAKLVLDSEGWTDAHELCRQTDFTIEELKQIVKDDEKQRYAMGGWPWKIRANQGHTTEQVKIAFKKAVPPVQLFHGTTQNGLIGILKQGILPMKRHHVHLSGDEKTAQAVGNRRRGGTVLRIDAKQMLADGIVFYQSENGVWLVDTVPVKYIITL